MEVDKICLFHKSCQFIGDKLTNKFMKNSISLGCIFSKSINKLNGPKLNWLLCVEYAKVANMFVYVG